MTSIHYDPDVAVVTESHLTEKEWVSCILEEYKSLRTEILEAGKQAQTMLQIGIVGMGALVAAGFNVWDRSLIPEVIFLGIIPLFAYSVGLTWLGEIARRMRASVFIRDVIEPEIGRRFGGRKPLYWESYLRTRDDAGNARHFRWNYYAAVAIFFGIPLFSFVVGNAKMWSHADPLIFVAINVVELSVLLVAIAYFLRIGRKFG